MSELLVNTIKKADGTGSLTVPAESGTVVTTASPSLGRRNLIINGAMQVAQRGTSQSGVSNSSGYYVCDRWKGEETGFQTPAFTISQETSVVPDGFGSALKYDVTTADSSLGADNSWIIQQRLEGQDVQGLKFGTSSAQSLTLSFWVYSNKTGTWIAELQNNDATRHISQAYTINSANVWEQKTLTFAGDTVSGFGNDNGASLYVNFWLYGGTNFTSGTLATSWAATTNANRAVGQVNFADSTDNNFYLTGVQLEVGDTATPFEHRSYGEELALCQRYYYEYVDSTENSQVIFTAWNSTDAYGVMELPVVLRSNPTVTSASPNDDFTFYSAGASKGSVNTLSFDSFSLNSVRVYSQGLSGLTAGYSGFLRIDNGSSVAFDAEL
jgi:hypothetical protein